ncbi:type II toxin-antitoxin system RelE/ParE family toxin [Mesorhizobium sp. ESP7-2]|uniref:type II toxin-antitoxin system RelE/ParE family toxin n=1 Tax=Mesorhizobium sp. ESP7-2 TaxID=2876622 RepID=UPI00398C66F5
MTKSVEFGGSALDDLRAFPAAARREAGHQLDQVQNGREPDDWKPMNTVLQGVREIRIPGCGRRIQDYLRGLVCRRCLCAATWCRS